MGKPAIIALVILLLAPAFAGDRALPQNVRSFSDQDLKKYRYPSESTLPVHGSGSGDSLSVKDNSPAIDRGDGKSQRYQVPYEPFEGTARRIIVPATLNGSVTAPMAVDTGAPGMLISYKLAEKLGVFSDDRGKVLIKAAGLGGTVPAIFTILDSIQVGGARDHFVPATVVPPLSSRFEGLIGMDFTAGYSVQIDASKHVIVFEELPARPNMAGGHDETWWRLTFRQFSSMRREWEAYREEIYDTKDDSGKVRELRKLADRQCEEAEKLLNKLHRYASDHAVPMNWREY